MEPGECVNLMVGSEDLDGVDPGAVVGLRIKHERREGHPRSPIE